LAAILTRYMTSMRVLLTDDDGVGAGGLGAIRAALARCCDRVITVAPGSDWRALSP
jgi:broad specificity polyphosphatase/5'/3'-nucleotidase SurE